MSVGDVLRTVASGLTAPDGLAWDGSSLWILDGSAVTIHQFDPLTATDLRSFSAPYGMQGDISFAQGALLHTSLLAASVSWLNPHDGSTLRALSLTGLYGVGVAWDGLTLWTANFSPAVITQYDPYSGAQLRSFSAPASAARSLGWDGHTLWLTDNGTDLIYQLDPYDGTVLRSFAAPAGDPVGIVRVQNTLWVCDLTDKNLYQLALN